MCLLMCFFVCIYHEHVQPKNNTRCKSTVHFRLMRRLGVQPEICALLDSDSDADDGRVDERMPYGHRCRRPSSIGERLTKQGRNVCALVAFVFDRAFVQLRRAPTVWLQYALALLADATATISTEPAVSLRTVGVLLQCAVWLPALFVLTVCCFGVNVLAMGWRVASACIATGMDGCGCSRW